MASREEDAAVDNDPEEWAQRLAMSEGMQPNRATSALMGSRGVRVGVMAAGAVAVIALLAILMLLVSLFVD